MNNYDLDNYDMENLNKDIDSFYNKYSDLSNKINKYEYENEKLVEATRNYDKVYQVWEKLDSYTNMIRLFNDMINTEDTNYKERRLNFLSEYINDNLNVIFPNEGFTTSINVDFKNKNQKTSLTLRNRYGRQSLPHVCEGKLLQELISFSSAIAIAECLGKDKFYMDEAFAASSPENLTKVGLLLKKLVEEGFQILLIEQKDDIYKDIPRREIYLHKNLIDDSVRVEEVLDY